MRSTPASARKCFSSAARKRAFRSIPSKLRSTRALSASSITGRSASARVVQAFRPVRHMQIGRVVGTVVSTQKHRKFEGAKLLLVQPLNLDDAPRGSALLAVDGVGAGVREKVLVVLEGRAAGEALGKKAAPVDAAIVGLIDEIEFDATL